MILRWGVAVAVMATVACGGKSGGAVATGDAAASDVTPAESEAGPDAFVTEVPDAFPDGCATALRVVLDATAPHTCVVSPGGLACEAANDCVVNLVPLCCGSDAIGVNRDASLFCAAQNCPPPPPAGSGIDCSPVVGTQDCRVVAARQDVGVTCVNHECLTYAVGGSDGSAPGP
jgi:hypothetical protein